MSHEGLRPEISSAQFVPEARVTDYLSASQNNDPMLYPGQRPESSYVTDGSYVYELLVKNDDGNLAFTMRAEAGKEVPANEFLAAAGVPGMEDRIPTLAFGANMSPGSLASKFKKVGRPDALVIPTVYAELQGHDIVWSGGPGANGNFIAILYAGEETRETKVQVGINFLTREQLLVLHATELAYQFSSVSVDVAGVPIRSYYYAGQDNVYAENGHPVAIESIPAHDRNLRSASTATLLDEILQDETLKAALSEAHSELTGADRHGYLAYVEKLKATAGTRLALKKLVHTQLLAQDKSRTVQIPGAIENQVSWANPSTIPTYGEQREGIREHDLYRLPSQEIPQWNDAEARRKVLNSFGTHFRRHKQ